jgi:chemotaxis methyl-accepting protein methylase
VYFGVVNQNKAYEEFIEKFRDGTLLFVGSIIMPSSKLLNT